MSQCADHGAAEQRPTCVECLAALRRRADHYEVALAHAQADAARVESCSEQIEKELRATLATVEERLRELKSFLGHAGQDAFAEPGDTWMARKIEEALLAIIGPNPPPVSDRERLWTEYVRLLADELNEAVSMAAAHGWKSKRYDAGCRLRIALGLEARQG